MQIPTLAELLMRVKALSISHPSRALKIYYTYLRERNVPFTDYFILMPNMPDTEIIANIYIFDFTSFKAYDIAYSDCDPND